MSDDYTATKTGADEFNQQAAGTVGWGIALTILAKTPNLGMSEEVVDLAKIAQKEGICNRPFRKIVSEYQKKNGLTVDEKLGSGTWRHMLRAQKFVGKGYFPGHILVGGMRVSMPVTASEIPIVLDCDEYVLTNYRIGCTSRNLMILHWGGLNPRSCWATLMNVKLSTHFMCDAEVVDGNYRIYQGVDLANTAYHAGRVNSNAIGLDICRSPQVKYKKYYTNPSIIASPAEIGERQIIDLPDDVTKTVRSFVGWVAGLFEIPFGAYPGDHAVPKIDDVISGANKEFGGVFGHHNVPDGARAGKWDIAPWQKIWPG